MYTVVVFAVFQTVSEVYASVIKEIKFAYCYSE